MLVHFGKAFTYKFYALSEDGFEFEALPDDPESIYLYDGKPSLADAASGAELSGSYELLQPVVNTWTNTTDANGKQISFLAVNDPDPSSETDEYKYWIAVNFEFEAGKVLAPILREITFVRPRAHDAIIDLSVDDLYSCDPGLRRFCTDYGKLDEIAQSAVKEVRTRIIGCKFSYADVFDPSVAKLATTYLAISRFYFSETRSPNDSFNMQAMRFESYYDREMKRIVLEFDKDKDGKPEEKVNRGFRSLRVKGP